MVDDNLHQRKNSGMRDPEVLQAGIFQRHRETNEINEHTFDLSY